MLYKLKIICMGSFFLITNCLTTNSTSYTKIPRLDEEKKHESIQVIKLSDRMIKTSFRNRETVDEIKKAYSQEDLLIGIKNYIESYSASKPAWEYANVEDYQSEKNKANPKNLEIVQNFFAKSKEPYIFTSHRDEQYSCCKTDWMDEKENLVITDFYGLYPTDSWSPYFIPFKYIPTDIEGIGIFSFTIDNKKIEFRANASKSIWRFQKYWAHIQIFSTQKGNDKSPLLIELSDPNDRGRSSQNGFYLILPKE